MSIQPPYIFISHSHQDREFTNWLAERLGKAGFHTWVDVENIPDGSSWPREIQRGVEGCGAMIVVLSRNSHDSEWVERETLLAMDLRKPLFIALIEDVPLPLHLINRQYSDFKSHQTRRREQAFTRLLTALEGISLTEPLPPPTARERAKLSPDPNEHNIFKFIEQLPDGPLCARLARDLHAWARGTADAITFSGRANPAFHAHIWLGPGGVLIFSVRAFPKQPAVEVPMQYFKDFPPYDDAERRLDVLRRFNALMPANEQLDESRADKRPTLPLATTLGQDGHLDQFIVIMSEIVRDLKAGSQN